MNYEHYLRLLSPGYQVFMSVVESVFFAHLFSVMKYYNLIILSLQTVAAVFVQQACHVRESWPGLAAIRQMTIFFGGVKGKPVNTSDSLFNFSRNRRCPLTDK